MYTGQTTKDELVTSVPTRVSPQNDAALADAFQDELRDALMQAPARICLTRGPQHVISIINTLYLKSIDGRNVVGLPMRDAFPAASADRIEMMDRAYQTGEPHTASEVVETIATQRGPEERSFNLVIQPLKDRNGAVYGLLLHAVDVTDQVRTRQELADLAFALERSNKELDSFAYAASHDLRAPLRGIANLAQWIEEDLVSSGLVKEETREMLELMRVRMHRMEALIEGLLQYSRAGRADHGPERVNVAALVREVVDLLSPPEGVMIVIEPDLPTLHTERLMLQQVFMNLIGNAIKHAAVSEDARIEVGSRRVGPFYEFSIKDNGPGIAPEFHDRIWGIFQTLEARDRVEGAGIGLALVKKIVESQRGRAWVESAPGSGATFRFLWKKSSR
jgi:signal transduction histidine kinase